MPLTPERSGRGRPSRARADSADAAPSAGADDADSRVRRARGLGPLEAEIMDMLWRAETPVRVRDVHHHLAARRELAYTTVMTVLDNLHRKGWVVRDLDRRAYRYQPARSREDAAVLALRELLDSTGDPEAVLLHFTRSVSERELAVLRKGIRGRSRAT